MNNLLEKVFNMETKHVHLFFLSKSDKRDDFEVFSTNPDSEIRSEVKILIHKQIANYLSDDECEPPIEYSPIFDDNSIVQKIDCGELKLLPNLIDKINVKSPIYDKTKLRKGHKLWLVAILMDDGIDKILSLQKIRSRTLLESKKTCWSIDEKISKFENQLLVLDDKIDCICLLENEDLSNQTMYIFHKYYFEQIFGFEEKFKKEIKNMLDELEIDDESSIKLDLEKFYSKIENNSRSLKKLYVILNNKNFNYLTEENIEKIETKSKDLKFNRSNGFLKLDSYDDIKKILNLLNDDYLEGILSQKPFKTSNKVDF